MAVAHHTPEPSPVPADPAGGAVQYRALVAVLWALVLAGGVVLTPVWPSLVLAAWFAVLARPLHARASRWLRGRSGAAGVLTVGLVVVMLAPIIGAAVSLGLGAAELMQRIATSADGRRALQRLVSDRPAIGDIAIGDGQRAQTEGAKHGGKADGGAQRGAVATDGGEGDGGVGDGGTRDGGEGSADGGARDGGAAGGGSKAGAAARTEGGAGHDKQQGEAQPPSAPQDGLFERLRGLLQPERVLQLLREHGGQAYRAIQIIAGATARAVLGLFLFVLGAYSFLVSGPEWYRFARRHAPIPPAHLDRLAGAFNETGRGLLIGVGLTALAQGLVGTVAYLALSIPSALVLGLMTALGALVPSVGSALVWVPVAAGLALSGRWGAALILVVVGTLVIGTIDNLLRPVFARFGALQLPTFPLFLSIFGGVALFGGFGLLLGPLLMRLCREALLLGREAGYFGERPSQHGPGIQHSEPT